jgi:hypothetical protein
MVRMGRGAEAANLFTVPAFEGSGGVAEEPRRGGLRIALRFYAGFVFNDDLSPRGTTEDVSRESAVPSGLLVVLGINPALKRRAILRCPSGRKGRANVFLIGDKLNKNEAPALTWREWPGL